MGLLCRPAGGRKGSQSIAPAIKTGSLGPLVARLLRELPQQITVPTEIVEKGRVLDNFYIPTRYPNSHPSGAPFEHYGTIQSEQAIQYAREILEFVDLQMAGPGNRR
jgi:HEPN domain-containing protein